MTNVLFIIALVAILLTTILILIMMSVAKSKSKEWLMEDAEQSECVRRMIKEREKKKAGKAL